MFFCHASLPIALTPQVSYPLYYIFISHVQLDTYTPRLTRGRTAKRTFPLKKPRQPVQFRVSHGLQYIILTAMDLMGIEPTVPRAFRFNEVTPP